MKSIKERDKMIYEVLFFKGDKKVAKKRYKVKDYQNLMFKLLEENIEADSWFIDKINDKEYILKEFLKEVETPLNVIKSVVRGQVNPLLKKYKEEYGLDFSDDVIDKILKVLEV